MSAVTPPNRCDSRTDTELVADARAGDDRAFETLYQRYRRRVTAYVHGMVGDWARAEDITQDVFVSALRRLHATDQEIVFKPWVFEIAKNATIDQFRRARRAEEVPLTEGTDEMRPAEHERLATPEPEPDAAAELGQQIENLRGAFGGLSDSHHRILVLRELEGRSYREIGEEMNLSRPGVESTLFRARRRLTEEYTDLATGERCRRVRGEFAALLDGATGVRERRRVERHLAWCRRCRADAHRAGLDSQELVRHGLSRVGAFLPLPLLLHRGASTGADALARSAASAPGLADQAAGGWKAAAAALALVAASTGAGVVSRTPAALADLDARPPQTPHMTAPVPELPPGTPPNFQAKPERPPVARRAVAPAAPRPSARVLRVRATSSVAGSALKPAASKSATDLERSAGPDATPSGAAASSGAGSSGGPASSGSAGANAPGGRTALGAPVGQALSSLAPTITGTAGTVDSTLAGVNTATRATTGTVGEVVDGLSATARGLLIRDR